eukprot:CAMPEP_0196573890 /NCGR_PEP_ID=MMETSP1081-20130531/3708_1 /TAXON_ID=36882 /ORGANISM="Pyramimonas amylifera, Strain CCMP720" /LENGTH=575 /DNA_ID=CAMNT_0041891739 /DNA_START=390 /DNA_END=2117 /DNA_ORIENTATION=-
MVDEREGAGKSEGAEDSSSSFASGSGSQGKEEEEETRYLGLLQGKKTGERGSAQQQKPLSAEWKRVRRDVEWKCRWLKLRMQDLNQQSQYYEHLEQQLMSTKAKAAEPGVEEKPIGSLSHLNVEDHPHPMEVECRRGSGEGASVAARTSLPFFVSASRQKIMRRRHRKRRRTQLGFETPSVSIPFKDLPPQQDVIVDQDQKQRVLSTKALMELACHPVLSRLCKRSRQKKGMKRSETIDTEGPNLSWEEVLSMKQQVMLGVIPVDELSSSDGDSEVSTMALWEKCDTLERRVLELKAQLSSVQSSKVAPTTPKGRGLGRPPGGPPGSATKLKQPIRRKNTPQPEISAGDNYYIASVTAGAVPKFEERLPHMLINTPSVRDLGFPVVERHGHAALAVAMASVSSEEDTTSEGYEARHSHFELLERTNIIGMVPGRNDKGNKKNSRANVGPGRGRGRASKLVNSGALMAVEDSNKNSLIGSEEKSLGQRVEDEGQDAHMGTNEEKQDVQEVKEFGLTLDGSLIEEKMVMSEITSQTDLAIIKPHVAPQVVNTSWKVTPSPRGSGSLKLVLKRTKPLD